MVPDLETFEHRNLLARLGKRSPGGRPHHAHADHDDVEGLHRGAG
jgi:hypothetical protein